MGAGKTTLGRAFAQATGLNFIDLDWYIEGRFRKTVQQLFAERGEEGFRELERRMLHEVGEFEDIVISTGGGTPCFFDNMDYMSVAGDTVFLRATPEVLLRRIKAGRQKRPLVAGKTDEELKDFIRDSLERRLPFYARAKHQIDADKLENRELVQSSVERLKERLGIPADMLQDNRQ